MRRLFTAIQAVSLAFATSASGESLYLTTSARLEQLGLGDTYTFIAPYVTSVQMILSVSIAKVATPANSANSSNSTPKAAAPLILHGQRTRQDAEGNWLAEFSVSCDLQTVLHPGSSITIKDASPTSYNRAFVVTDVTPNQVYANAGKPALDSSLINGTISDASCPPAATDSFSVTFTVTSVPKSRAYLYLTKNALFSDTLNVTTDNNGLLSGAESASAQQVTAILTELAQIAGLFVPLKTLSEEKGIPDKKNVSPRRRCFSAIADEVKVGPFFARPQPNDLKRMYEGKPWLVALDADPGVSLAISLAPLRTSTGLVGLNNETTVEVKGKLHSFFWHNGLVAFFPVSAVATISCLANGGDVLLTSPTTINLYSESQFLDPQRDFLTNPQDAFTFNAGFIIGHKYSDQSSAKTIIDTVTAPLRALIPSVSVQQSTQVQTGGGKPDQTTSTTQTTTGPPKSP